MRTTHRCPKCQGQKLYVCENHQPNPRYSSSVVKFHITAVELAADGTAGGEASAYRTNVGTYETWTCAACGYTEWYAQDEQGVLERLSHVAQSGVRVVEPGAGPPYR